MADADRPTFRAAPAHLDLPALEEEILGIWEDNGVPERSLQWGARAWREGKAPAYVFFDGPPFATGLPHYGHILPGTIKDIVPRYFTMRGFAVERRFGWDCHGLPIESLVQDELGLAGAADIEAHGVAAFNEACRAGVLKYVEKWRDTVRRMGRWVDFEDDYKTMDPAFMESVWWVFRRLWDLGLVYEGYRVQPVSPALATPLSNFEVAQGPQERDPVTRKEGHKRRQDPSITVRFKLADEDAFLWAWTTTPWTLPSNLALAVHPDLVYAKVRFEDTGEVAYLEESRLSAYREAGKVGPYEVLARVPGRDLAGRPYEPLFPYFERYRTPQDGYAAAFRVVAADYVSTDAGTGIVHQAPAFGEDDFEVGRRENLPIVNPLSLSGVFDERVPDLAGMFAKDADKVIVGMLKEQGKLVDQDTIVHPYPHCYRTEQPLLYMALSTWFVKVEPLRRMLVENNETIHWVPEHVGRGRFGNWLAEARDWNVARNRFWGTPLPIWRCDEDPSDMVCIGSVAELERRAGLAPGTIRDLHRHYVDDITFPSDKTPGGTMRRVREVFDCWFESGSMPYAQNHYPFDETRKRYVEDHLPADFIAEGLDQTRGWFYTLHVLATALFRRPAFKNVIVNGLILAEDGKKMSKRLKNYPDPNEVIDRYGADALRAYLVSGPAVRAEPMRFSEQGVRDTVRTAVLPLWNAYRFFVTYARAEGFVPSAADLAATPAHPLDRWIRSRTQSFLAEIREAYESYHLDRVVPAYQRMCDDLNNWYIRRSRRRFWRGLRDDEAGQREAFATLYATIVTIVHAIAPVLPFTSEWLYLRLVQDVGLGDGAASVHERSFPEPVAGAVDAALERDVAIVRRVVALALAAREKAQVAVRRPLATLTVAAADPVVRAAVERFGDDVRAEVNVHALAVRADDASFVHYGAKANFKRLGPRLGKRMKAVAAAVAALSSEEVRSAVERGSVEVAGEVLSVDDILVTRAIAGDAVAQTDGDVTVALDTEITDELRAEGWAREVVNRVQNLRKAADLDVSDRIHLALWAEGALGEALARPAHERFVAGETLAERIDRPPEAAVRARPHVREDVIDGMRLVLGLARADGGSPS